MSNRSFDREWLMHPFGGGALLIAALFAVAFVLHGTVMASVASVMWLVVAVRCSYYRNR